MKALTRLMLVGLFACSLMVMGGCDSAEKKDAPAEAAASTEGEDHDHAEGEDHDHAEGEDAK